jgi:hypothetical protein
MLATGSELPQRAQMLEVRRDSRTLTGSLVRARRCRSTFRAGLHGREVECGHPRARVRRGRPATASRSAGRGARRAPCGVRGRTAPTEDDQDLARAAASLLELRERIAAGERITSGVRRRVPAVVLARCRAEEHRRAADACAWPATAREEGMLREVVAEVGELVEGERSSGATVRTRWRCGSRPASTSTGQSCRPSAMG